MFSHPSKLDLITEAKGLGYRVMTFHISVAHADLSVARVTERVKEGGHPVPEEKIRNRYDRSGPLQDAKVKGLAVMQSLIKTKMSPAKLGELKA